MSPRESGEEMPLGWVRLGEGLPKTVDNGSQSNFGA